MFTDKLLYKFSAHISLLICFSSFILSFIFIRHESKTLKTALEERAHTLVHSLAHNSDYGVLTKNYLLLDGFTNGAMEEKDVVWVEIADGQGKALSSKGQPQKGDYYQTESAILIANKSNNGGIGEDMLFPEEQNEEKKVEQIGTVRLALSLTNINKEIKRIGRKALVLTLLIVFISISLTVLFVTKLTGPIRQLALVTQKIAQGDLTARSGIKSNDEVGQLAGSFNQMIEDLQKTLVSKEDLEKSNSILASTIESTADGIVVVDTSNKIVTFNHRFIELWGIPGSMLPLKDKQQLITFVATQMKEPDLFLNRVKQILNQPESESFDLIELKDGRTFERFTLPQRLNHRVIGRVVNYRDITERKKLQERIMQSDKMSAIGQLAGGVAHEINNPLGVILGFAQSISKKIKESDPLTLPIQSIDREAKRCKNLVQDLLTFSRVGKPEKELCDVNEVIQNALSLVETQTKVKAVELIKNFGENIEKAMINRNQIQQVVINLCNNAIDAMPKGGTLTISTKVLSQQSPPEARLSPRFGEAGTKGGLVPSQKLNGSDQEPRNKDQGDGVQIVVSDTGDGIPKEIQSKIFEPFFTTKPIGKGTGLGLSLVYEIVQKHNGTIEIETEAGKGTGFIITLPANA